MIGIAIGVVGAAAGLFYWIAAASWLYCRLSHHMDLFIYPYDQWLDALDFWHSNGWTQVYIVVSAAAPVLLPGLVYWNIRNQKKSLRRPFGGGLKPAERGVTENHGRAYWPDIHEMVRRYPQPPDSRGGVVIGEARRIDLEPCKNIAFNGRDRSTWGQGGKAPLLIDDPMSDTSPSPHSLMFIGTGGGKTMHAVATQYCWRGSLVTFDPSCEIGPMVKQWREKLGQQVIYLGYPKDADEIGIDDLDREGIDVLACIQPQRSGASARILSMTASICGEEIKRKDSNSIFDNAGRNIIACFMAHMMYDTTSSQPKTIETLIEGLNIPEPQMQELLQTIATSSESELARRLAITVMNSPKETFGGAYFNLGTMAGWILDPENARLLSGRLKPEEILQGGLSIYIQIPTATLLKTAGVGRTIADSIVNSVIQANGHYADFMLFQADEAALLERMLSLEVVLKMGRKYGMAVQLIYTSIDDMREIWTENGLKTWLNGVSWAAFAAVTHETADWLSKRLGKHGVMAVSEGSNQGSSGQMMGTSSRSKGSNTNVHEIGHNLINPDDFQDSRTDEAFIVTRSGRAFRCGLAPYYRRPEMTTEIQKTSYFKEKAA